MKGELPPLNSVHKYTISVEVEPSYYDLHYDPRFLEPQFAIHSLVSVKYKSVKESNQTILDGLLCKSQDFYFPCRRDVIINFNKEAVEFIKTNILDKMYIPFELDKNFVATRILEVARLCLMRPTNTTSTSTSYHNVLPLKLDITKKIELPDFTLRSYNQFYRAGLYGAKGEYERAISRPRTMEEELAEQHSRIDQETMPELDDDSSCCTICLEKMLPGYYAVLPCSHIFHLDCVFGWIWSSRRHRCPLCRDDFFAKKGMRIVT
ncbi:hypothetical protein ACH5RR_033236 [Cinchona calisaya]|uniref:RING-type domain-containing protein n=1 Tax=Cinchona calisaya TaxID=153742 RepID=A0ABD2YKD0_9GENT